MGNVHFVNDDFTYENGVLVASPGWYKKVHDAAQEGNKSILMLQFVFFPTGIDWREDMTGVTDRLSALSSALDTVKSSVVGIYLFDEPYWGHGGLTGPIVINRRLTSAAVLARSYFPLANMIVTEGAPAVFDGQVSDIPDDPNDPNHPPFRLDVVNDPISFPADVDWVGVNCYRYLYYPECGNEPNEELWKKLRLKPNQKMVFTLDGFYNRAGPIKTFEQFLEWNEKLKKIAAGYPTIALIPFLYQSTQNQSTEKPDGKIGTEDMPELKDYFSFVGGSVKGGTFTYGPISVAAAPAPPPQCTVLAPTCEGRDSVRRNSCGVEIDRWVNAPPPYCPAQCTVLEPTCEGRDYVRRNSCGAVIDRWVNAPPPYCQAQCTVLEPTCEGRDYVRRNSCGAEIERWANAPPPYCQPQCTVLEPTCEGRDYVRRNSCGAEIERWVNAPPPYCSCRVLEPTCEGRDYVRRNSCGAEIERWANAPPPYCPAR